MSSLKLIDLDKLCGTKHWNQTLSWLIDHNPDLTYCFEETCLLWTICLCLFLLTCFQVLNLWKKSSIITKNSSSSSSLQHHHYHPHPIPWNIINVTNLIICTSLIIINFIEILNIIIWNNSNLIPIKPIEWLSPSIKIITLDSIYYVEINYIHYICRTMSTILAIFYLLFNCFSYPEPTTTTITKTSSNIDQHNNNNNLEKYPLSSGYNDNNDNDRNRHHRHRHIKHQTNNQQQSNNQINPWFHAGFLSRITFWWFNSIIWLGYRRPLLERDIFQLDYDNRTVEILRKFQKNLDQDKWRKMNKQLIEQNKNGYEQPLNDKFNTNINIGWIIFKSYWPLIMFSGLLKFLSSILTFVNPTILDYLISFISTNNEPLWHGFFYASLMFLSPALESIMSNQYEYWISIVVLRARISIISIIYKKSLRMSNLSRAQYSSGEVTNIMSVDSERITDFLVVANMLWSAPLQIAIAFYMLWQQVQVASMAGLSFMIILIPFNGFVMKKIRSYQIQVMRQKDKRTKLMNEILNGMKVLKLYAWENSFLTMITKLRNFECRLLYRVTLFSGFIVFAFTAAPFLVGLLTFATFVLMGNVLDPNKAFVSLSLFSIIRAPLGLLPMLLTNGVQSYVSMTRVNKYLNTDEQDERAVKKLPDEECSVRIRNGTFTWSPESPATLKNINLNVTRGKLIVIVGTVGSGKSSILSAILGDMDKLQGHINVDGRLAYVPQQAWIQNQTVRKNITFASSYDEQKYKKILRSCCLEADMKILEAGDRTEIGERGINLSGGQKQRISLARAVYSDADIYILDDPLSAVDANVGDKLFQNVIGNKGILCNKTRILATHRAMILPEVDEIIVMKNGEISERGTMNELMDSQGAFAEFINEFMDENFGGNEIELSLSVNESEMVKSFAEKVRPILERSKSRTDSTFVRSTSIVSTTSPKKTKPKHRKELSTSSSIDSQVSIRGHQGSMSIHLSKEIHQQKNQTEQKDKGKLIQEEIAQTGSVKFTVYGQYFRKIGLSVTIFIFIAAIVGNGFQMATYLWLTEWSNDALDPIRMFDESLRNFRLIIYASLGSFEILFTISSSLILSLACIRAAKLLHNDMLQRIMFAPMSFFDTTPTGRILNRFTKDIDVADNSLSFNIRMTLMQFLRTIVSFAMISLEAPIILIALIPILFLYYIVQRLYIASSRQLKRIESITRSPIYHHFTETVNGISSIRAYGVEKKFINECNNRLDKNCSSYYCSRVAARWLSIRLEFFGYIIVFLAALFAVLSRNVLSPGLAGLAISYSLNITQVIGMFVRTLTDVETNIISVERILEYSEIEQEKNYQQKFPKPNIGQWPKKGEIKFQSYSTRYRQGLNLVLRNIQFNINSREKIGVVGRTGAGKSSLTLALFRIIEPITGTILIDNIDITKIGLYDLRSRITIIPQDPVLFTGDLRTNLDPFQYYDDIQIWQALELAHLKQFVQTLDGGLLYKIIESGENISVGQRQLVCLARALLRKSKILILDEATAAVDMETDELIQKTIRKEFSDCTIVTIAHRLNTVIDYDRILVLDQGKIAEYDTPKNLLNNHDSLFYSMAKIAKLI
ncbi:multidrug resistance-associated protein 1-like isoform X2 [Dermatophagoides pteronyssinus]|uniref:multidrug resistance-associated protein 1-like isoform X2 n=1 Tax=Dermatophagoides pteronyssinus TaxID=6956 RepID=UPI003F6675DB